MIWWADVCKCLWLLDSELLMLTNWGIFVWNWIICTFIIFPLLSCVLICSFILFLFRSTVFFLLILILMAFYPVERRLDLWSLFVWYICCIISYLAQSVAFGYGMLIYKCSFFIVLVQIYVIYLIMHCSIGYSSAINEEKYATESIPSPSAWMKLASSILGPMTAANHLPFYFQKYPPKVHTGDWLY